MIQRSHRQPYESGSDEVMTVSSLSTAARIAYAVRSAGLSQRGLADRTGLSQASLSRVITGQRVPSLPDLVLISQATGVTFNYLAGVHDVARRVRYATRATNGASMETMRESLLHFVELNAYLEDQAIPASHSAKG